jgi:hypothetical protein
MATEALFNTGLNRNSQSRAAFKPYMLQEQEILLLMLGLIKDLINK